MLKICSKECQEGEEGRQEGYVQCVGGEGNRNRGVVKCNISQGEFDSDVQIRMPFVDAIRWA